MTENRTPREIAIDFYRAEWNISATAAAEAVDDLDAAGLDAIVAAVAAQPHLAPAAERVQIDAEESCGCPITAEVDENDDAVEGTIRTEHVADCPDAPAPLAEALMATDPDEDGDVVTLTRHTTGRYSFKVTRGDDGSRDFMVAYVGREDLFRLALALADEIGEEAAARAARVPV